LKSTVIASGLGQFVKTALGVFDLGARREINRSVEGDVDHVFANADQIAPQRKIIDRASVIMCVDDCGRFGRQTREILADRHAAEIDVGRQEGFQRDRGRDLSHPDQAAGRLEDGLMDRLVEVLRLEKVRNAIKCVVVDENGAEQALFRFDIVRRAPIVRSSRIRAQFENVRIGEGHEVGNISDPVLFDSNRAVIKRQRHEKRKRILDAYAPVFKRVD